MLFRSLTVTDTFCHSPFLSGTSAASVLSDTCAASVLSDISAAFVLSDTSAASVSEISGLPADIMTDPGYFLPAD